MLRQSLKPLIPQPIRRAVGLSIGTIGRAFLGPVNYNAIHVKRAWKMARPHNGKVLVVGANDGRDCWRFLRLGAREVHGLDVIDNVGSEIQHERIVYHRDSIEHCKLSSNQFDLVFATATMEHVRDIRSGFAEMARVTKSGGFIWSLAAPLWNSAYGHHMECFHGHPWVHLLYGHDELLDYARAHGITGERGQSIEFTVDYMTSRCFFNQRPSSDYLEACSGIKDVEHITNEIQFDNSELLTHSLARAALSRGFSQDEMLGMAHYFVAKKIR